jgi:deoxycytidine triphosphate deaminase
MFLADRDIKKMLPEMDIETDNKKHLFSLDQIQSSSIDLRESRLRIA